MPRLIHPDDDMVYACPGCGSARNLWERTERAVVDPEKRCHCTECGHSFDDPDVRPARPGCTERFGLADMDPDEVPPPTMTDGGRDTIVCPICGAVHDAATTRCDAPLDDDTVCGKLLDDEGDGGGGRSVLGSGSS